MIFLERLTYDLLKNIMKRIFSDFLPGFEDDDVINRLYQASERATKAFFGKYKDDFGPANNSFLSRQENFKVMLNLVFVNKGELRITDFNPKGYGEYPEATQEACQFFIDSLKQEISTDRVLVDVQGTINHYRENREGFADIKEAIKSLEAKINEFRAQEREIKEILLKQATQGDHKIGKGKKGKEQRAGKLRVFLSSPGDVANDRHEIEKLINELIRETENRYGIQLIPVTFEKDAPRGAGRPQAMVNNLIDECDIYLGFIGLRLGSKTGLMESGTYEEFIYAYHCWEKSKKPLMRLFFKKVSVDITSLKKDDHEQIGKVIDFKELIKGNFFPDEYSNIDELKDKVKKELKIILGELSEKMESDWEIDREPEEEICDPESSVRDYFKHIVSDAEFNSMPVVGKDKRVALDKLYIHLRMTAGGYKAGMLTDSDQLEAPLPREGGKVDLHRLKPDQALNLFGRLAVIGPPGMGKTTLLHYIAYSLAKKGLDLETGEFEWLEGSPQIPIYCPLARIADEDGKDLLSCIKNFLQGRIADCPWDTILDELLVNGRCLLLLDGLDEIFSPEKLAAVKEKIKGFLTHSEWGKNRVVLTCREANWPERDSGLMSGFKAVLQISELDETGILEYLRNWFGAAQENSVQILKNQILGSRDARLRELTGNAFLLSLITYLSTKKSLPERRVELYERCAGALLEEEHRPGHREFTFLSQLKSKVLAEVAFSMMENGQREVDINELIASAGRAMNITDPLLDNRTAEIIEEIYQGSSLLREISVDGDKKYEFMHRQFLEYYAAERLREGVFEIIKASQAGVDKKRLVEYLKAASIPESKNPFARLQDSSWAEVYRLVCGMLTGKQPEVFLDYVFDIDPTLAARCYLDADGSQVNHELIRNRWRGIEQKERVKIIFGIREQIKETRQVMDFIRSLFAKVVEQDPEVLYNCDEVLDGIGTEEAKQLSLQMFDWWPEERQFSVFRNYFTSGNFWDFAELKSGLFKMGGNKYDSEQPIHEVKLSSFQMGKYAVTVGQYRCFDPVYVEEMAKGHEGFFREANQPMVFVSWYDAYIFSKWAGGRLPSEAEWEYACRGGTEGEYYWGDNFEKIGDYAWWSGNSEGCTHPVGKREANAFGLHDMIGNVWEWCHDWYEEKYYHESPKDNPAGPKEGACRVSRGGGWWCGDPALLRSAYRGWYDPASRYGSRGFRLVRLSALKGPCSS